MTSGDYDRARSIASERNSHWKAVKAGAKDPRKHDRAGAYVTFWGKKLKEVDAVAPNTGVPK